MEKKRKFMKILIIAAVAVIACIAGFRMYAKSHITDGGGMTVYDSYPQLQGEWKEVNYGKASQREITISGGEFTYTANGEVKDYPYYIGSDETYNLRLDDSVTISFDEDAPWFGDLVYHTQETDGHTIHILSAFLYEDDGRGLIVADEFVLNDDLQYVTSDFESDLYHRLNDSEAVPTVAEVTVED